MDYKIIDTIVDSNRKPLIIKPEKNKIVYKETKDLTKRLFTRFINYSKDQLYSVMQDDLDSMVTCKYLWNRYRIPVGGFYDFKKLVIDPTIIKVRPIPIYIDVEVNGHEFGIANHVRCFDNGCCFNLNECINGENYSKKFAGSTYLSALYFNGEDINNKSEKQLELLVLIDSFYKQYFGFPDKWNFWIDYIGCDALNNIIKKHPFSYFEEIQNKYNMKSHIYLNSDGRLWTYIDCQGINEEFGVDIQLPSRKYNKTIAEFKYKIGQPSQLLSEDVSNIFTHARTYKNQVRYSIVKK